MEANLLKFSEYVHGYIIIYIKYNSYKMTQTNLQGPK